MLMLQYKISAFIRFFFLLYALPVCRGSAWTGVWFPHVSFCTETPNATGHRATESPGGSRPTPFAPHIAGGLALLYSDMKNSTAHTNKHTHNINPQSFTKPALSKKINTNTLSSLNTTFYSTGASHTCVIKDLMKNDLQVIEFWVLLATCSSMFHFQKGEWWKLKDIPKGCV